MLSFRPKLEFQYAVGGRDYTTVAPAMRSNNYAWVQEKMERYAPGTHHAVWYNPADPADVRLDAGFNFDTFGIPLLLGLLGAVFAPLAFGLLYAGTRTTHLPCAACGVMLPKAAKFCADCGMAVTSV